MKVLSTLTSLALLSGVALGKIGDTCKYKGLTGSCIESSKCRSHTIGAPGWFYVSGACPDDGSSVKCCLQVGCYVKGATGNSNADGYGWCQNTNWPCQAGLPGTKYVSDKCPGGTDVKCCIFG